MMKIAALLCAVFVAANAGLIAPSTLVRTPQFDSAVIKSDRLGGNFAYSTSEGHAYAAVSPVVQNVVSPVAVSYSAHQVAAPAVPVAYAAAAYPAAYSYGAYPSAYSYGAYPGAYAYGAYPAHSGVVVA